MTTNAESTHTFTDPTGLYYVTVRTPPPVGMTPDEVLQGYYYGMGIEVSSRWRFAPGPNTGLWGAWSLARGRGFLDSLRDLYQERFDRSAVAGGLNYNSVSRQDWKCANRKSTGSRRCWQ